MADRQSLHLRTWGGSVSLVAESTQSSSALVRARDRARDRSERERRRVLVARRRWIDGNQTAAEIATELAQLQPPILVAARTVERDCHAIQADARRYLTAANCDARFEVGAALMRHEMLARKATQSALAAKDAEGAKWARIAIRATDAKTQLLQDIGLIDRQIGTLFIDDGKKAEHVPSGAELQALFDSVNVRPGDLVNEAERAWEYGDPAASNRAANEASAGFSAVTESLSTKS
jgi:hypothetical protein